MRFIFYSKFGDCSNNKILCMGIITNIHIHITVIIMHAYIHTYVRTYYACTCSIENYLKIRIHLQCFIQRDIPLPDLSFPPKNHD